ncbi:MFS transporter [Leptolyngbya sp. FACHB-261]|nr:MFS transporter [Leptolyngbya sp. FACHB-261]
MFQSIETLLAMPSAQFGLAQAILNLPLAQIVLSPDESALFFLSGPQFFIALIAGVVMAFAFQFLLTNISVAAGISGGAKALDTDSDESWGKSIRKVEAKVGLWTLFTVNTALFIACFLAVKLTLINSGSLGAIVGVVIWSVYFLLLLWVSSQAVGSLVSSVVDTASSGLQGVMGTAATALSGRAINNQVVNTVEASVEAATRELRSAIAPDRVRDGVEDYLTNLQLPGLNLGAVRSGFETLLRSSDLQSLADSDLLKQVNRETFVNLVSQRTDFSKQDVERVADQLETAWNQVVKQGRPPELQANLLDFVQSALPEELKGGQLRDRLEQLIQPQQNQQNQQDRQNPQKQGSLTNRALQMGIGTLMSTLSKRVDLSDLGLEKIAGQLNSLSQQLTEQASKVGSGADGNASAGQPPFSTIRTDIESYLLNSPPWHLNRETLDLEFRETIYDPEANPGNVRQQLESLNRDYFVNVLTRREGITPEKVNEVADQLEQIRQDVFETVRTAEEQERSQDLRQRLENYLRSTSKEELNPENIERSFTQLLADPEASYEILSNRLSQFDRETLKQILVAGRQDLSQEEADQILTQLESSRDRFLSQSQETWNQAQAQAGELRQRVEAYLRDTNLAELNPEGIQQELRTLLDDPQAGLSALRSRLSQFDRDTLVQLLTQRGDLSEEQVNQVIDQIESVRDSILGAPQQLAGQAKEQYDRVTTQIAEYLRGTNLEELNPEGIQRDLLTLLSDPTTGTSALRERLSQVDRETLVKLLSQRGDLNEEQVNQIIDQVQEAIRSIIKAPRRLAIRAGERVRDFQSDLTGYLRNTNKEELNPEGIKRDLQLLLRQPQAGMSSLGDRLSQFDRSTLVALLSQREDISEEEANQIVEQIISVRDQLDEQIQAVQRRAQAALDSVFTRTRDYLNSLDRPELNYEGIQHDFRKLFDDPEAGFDALRDRLGQFDRDTLVALLSSRSDISEEQANRVVNQIEGVRDGVLNRAERLQQQAQKRIKELKHKAKAQAEEAQKTVATAAWWLFGTAATSVATAAIAGVIAAGGLTALGLRGSI